MPLCLEPRFRGASSIGSVYYCLSQMKASKAMTVRLLGRAFCRATAPRIAYRPTLQDLDRKLQQMRERCEAACAAQAKAEASVGTLDAKCRDLEVQTFHRCDILADAVQRLHVDVGSSCRWHVSACCAAGAVRRGP